MDPWSKGDYSRHIREALMVVEKLPKVNPPSGWVSGQVRRVVPILESSRRRNRGKFSKNKGLLRVSELRGKYRPKGAPGGGPSAQAPSWHGLGWGRARWPPG